MPLGQLEKPEHSLEQIFSGVTQMLDSQSLGIMHGAPVPLAAGRTPQNFPAFSMSKHSSG